MGERLSERVVLPLIIDPDAIFWNIYVEITNLDDFWKINKIITDAGLNVVDIHFTRLVAKGGVFILVNATNSKLSLDALYEDLKCLEGVKDIEVVEIPIKGYGFHWLLYPPQLGPFHIVILIDRIFSTLVNEIKNIWGTAGDLALYRIGETVGMDIYKTAKSAYRKNGKDLVSIILMISRLMGWMESAELLEFDGDKGLAKIRIYDNVECRYVKRDIPNSQFIRGIIYAIFNQIFNRPIEVSEKKCLAMGDDYCEYIVSVKKG